MSRYERLKSADLMRVQNARKILKTIHVEKGIYRKMLAARTNLAAQTVTNIITILIDKGIVLEQPLNTSGKGRNPFSLEINYSGFYIISIKAEGCFMEVYLNGLDGKVYFQEGVQISQDKDALAILKGLLHNLYEKCGSQYKASAVVISVTGIVNEKEAVVIESEGLNWHQFSIAGELAYLNIPVFVLNDVNLIAHYENANQTDDMNFMLVRVDQGVGSAMVIDRHVVYSTNRVSGEFGHVKVMRPKETVRCFCGRKNCITQFISRNSLSRRLGMPYEEIKAAVAAGEPRAVETVTEIGSLVAQKLSDLVVLLDLDRIVLFGEVIEDFKEYIYPGLRNDLQQDLTYWVRFNNLEIKTYDDFPQICSQYLMSYYFSNENDLQFLWDSFL